MASSISTAFNCSPPLAQVPGGHFAWMICCCQRPSATDGKAERAPCLLLGPGSSRLRDLTRFVNRKSRGFAHRAWTVLRRQAHPQDAYSIMRSFSSAR